MPLRWIRRKSHAAFNLPIDDRTYTRDRSVLVSGTCSHKQKDIAWGKGEWVAPHHVASLVTLPASALPVRLLPNLDIQPLDLLIQRRQRHVQAFRRFRLAPAALFQPIDDGPPFVFIAYLEQRCIGR